MEIFKLSTSNGYIAKILYLCTSGLYVKHAKNINICLLFIHLAYAWD